jgi:hypothetical protein
VYVVLAASKLVGTNVKIVPLLLKVTVPVTGTPPADNTTALLPTLVALSGALIMRSTRTLAGVAFAPLAGLTITTVGADVSVAKPVVKEDPKTESA